MTDGSMSEQSVSTVAQGDEHGDHSSDRSSDITSLADSYIGKLIDAERVRENGLLQEGDDDNVSISTLDIDLRPRRLKLPDLPDLLDLDDDDDLDNDLDDDNDDDSTIPVDNDLNDDDLNDDNDLNDDDEVIGPDGIPKHILYMTMPSYEEFLQLVTDLGVVPEMRHAVIILVLIFYFFFFIYMLIFFHHPEHAHGHQ